MPTILEFMGVNLSEAPWREAENYLQDIVRRRRVNPAALDSLEIYNLFQDTALASRDPSIQAALDAASVFLLDGTLHGRQLAHLVKGGDSLSPVLGYLQFLAETNDFPSLQKYIDVLPEPLLWRIYATEVYDAVMSVSFARDLTDAHVKGAIDHLNATGGQTVLDIGAGTGLVAMDLADGDFQVVAVEPNSAMAEILGRRLSGLTNVEIHNHIFEKVDLGGRQFDVVNLRNVLYLINDPEKFMQKVFSHLKPGGKVFISGPMPNAQEILPLLAGDISDELSTTRRKEEIWRFALVGPINKRLLRSSYIRHADEVADMLRKVGFEVGEGDLDTRFYRGSTYLIQATRPDQSSKIVSGDPASGKPQYSLDESADSVGAHRDAPAKATSPERRSAIHGPRTTSSRWHLRGARSGVVGRSLWAKTARI